MPDNQSRDFSLARLQEWFGHAISRPLPDAYPANPLALSAPGLEGEADALMRGAGDLTGFARAGIYNQQYWFRLISIMQSEYPCAVHLAGLRAFNEWAVRFLEAHPPASPYLAELDAGFAGFLAERYDGGRREEVLQAVAYDRALSKAFDAREGITLAAAGTAASAAGTAASAAGSAAPADLMAAKLELAPHVTPLRLDWDFADFRAQCLPDESLEGRFELKPEASCLVIFRGSDRVIMKLSVASPALAVLEAFREAATLTEAFEKLEGRIAPGEQDELASGISGWFRDWVERGWLCLAAPAQPADAPGTPARSNKSER